MECEKGGRTLPPLHFLVQQLWVSTDTYLQNVAYSTRLYEEIEEQPAQSVPLAVVGGGASAAQHLDELRKWPGDVWSIKGAAKWLKRNGVDSAVISCHPTYHGEDWPDYAASALLEAGCPPSLFERLKVPVRIFRTSDPTGSGVSGSVTSLGRTPHLALKLGYRVIHFFGADSSMEGQSHAYENRHSPEQIIVQCNGREFLSQADWIWQAEYLSDLCRRAPKSMVNRSSGLLAAMIESGGKYEVSAVSDALWQRIGEKAA